MAFYKKQVKAPGVAVKSGAEIDIESGGALQIGGTSVSASAVELNLNDKTAETVTADGAITNKNGVTILLKDPAGVVAATLADPTAGTDDYKTLTIIGGSAHAHTVTNAGGFGNGGAGKDVATFGGAVGDCMTIIAYGGQWYIVGLNGVTLA